MPVKNTFIHYDISKGSPLGRLRADSCPPCFPPWSCVAGSYTWAAATQVLCHAMAPKLVACEQLVAAHGFEEALVTQVKDMAFRTSDELKCEFQKRKALHHTDTTESSVTDDLQESTESSVTDDTRHESLYFTPRSSLREALESGTSASWASAELNEEQAVTENISLQTVESKVSEKLDAPRKLEEIAMQQVDEWIEVRGRRRRGQVACTKTVQPQHSQSACTKTPRPQIHATGCQKKASPPHRPPVLPTSSVMACAPQQQVMKMPRSCL